MKILNSRKFGRRLVLTLEKDLLADFKIIPKFLLMGMSLMMLRLL